MKNWIYILIFFCGLIPLSVHAQAKELSLSGYVSGMPSIIVQAPSGDVWWQMLVHNRLDFDWQMGKYFRMKASMRNRLIAGSELMINPQTISYDPGWLDLSWNWKEWKYAVGNSSLDRLLFSFEKNKWKLQLGRQRINWGQTFVWNPNDIFNTYSFFDFDYQERPGCDALSLTYYHNETSSHELAVSVNRNEKVTAAYLYRWNFKGIDFQVIAGEQTESDLVVGGAITSDIKGLNVRTEMSYFQPIKKFADTSGTLAVSLGLDYIFSNSLMLQTEVLYNNMDKHSSGGNLMDMYAAPLSAKRLSICEWNIFASTSYPLTPRLNGTLSGIYFVDIQSCYAGITMDYSILENLDFSFIAQYFYLNGKSSLSKDMHMLMGFVRIKYSF